MRFTTICFAFVLSHSIFVAKSQEYYRSIIIKPDSVEIGTVKLMQALQRQDVPGADEVARLYRDSLAAALTKTDTLFASADNFEPVKLDALLPRRSFRLISDLLWREFVLSSDKITALNKLRILGRHYPNEEYVQGNLSLAYHITGKPDSALAVLNRYLARVSEGFVPAHIAKSILDNSANGQLQKIIGLGADSFALWTQDKLYKYPAALDSLRNALAVTIIHRAGAVTKPDPITGRLIFDFGDLTVKDKLYAQGLPFYDLATVYAPNLQPAVAERKRVIAEVEKSVNDTFKWASIFYAIPLLSFVLILVSWLRSKRMQGRKADEKPR